MHCKRNQTANQSFRQKPWPSEGLTNYQKWRWCRKKYFI